MKKVIVFILFGSMVFADSGKVLFSKYGCYGCHGSDASGMGEYPKLSGLPVVYIKKRLKAYKDGKLNSNRANIMKAFAKPLSKKDIDALANYLNSLKKKDTDDKRDEYYEEYDPFDSSSS